MEDRIILVDLYDHEIGIGKKMEVHEKGLLHRAFSIFIFDGSRLLIQKRAAGKYHSAGLWANSCCSHPREGEELSQAVSRRLLEETGIQCETREAGSFVYRAVFENGLTEYEYDHVFIGEYSGAFVCNKEEAEDMKFVEISELEESVRFHPERYCAWFITALPLALQYRNR